MASLQQPTLPSHLDFEDVDGEDDEGEETTLEPMQISKMQVSNCDRAKLRAVVSGRKLLRTQFSAERSGKPSAADKGGFGVLPRHHPKLFHTSKLHQQKTREILLHKLLIKTKTQHFARRRKWLRATPVQHGLGAGANFPLAVIEARQATRA